MTGAHIVPPGRADNWRQVAEAAPALAEPVTIAEGWKNRRGESIRLVLSLFQGRSIFDLRTRYTADGKLKPEKGFAVEVRHLPRLAAAIAKTEATARELGLIGDEGMSKAAKPLIAVRERLPNRRAHTLLNIEAAGFRYVAGVGHYDDGRLAEIFLTAEKGGTAIDDAARDSTVVACATARR
jgi:hypothetical protein